MNLNGTKKGKGIKVKHIRNSERGKGNDDKIDSNKDLLKEANQFRAALIYSSLDTFAFFYSHVSLSDVFIPFMFKMLNKNKREK